MLYRLQTSEQFARVRLLMYEQLLQLLLPKFRNSKSLGVSKDIHMFFFHLSIQLLVKLRLTIKYFYKNHKVTNPVKLAYLCIPSDELSVILFILYERTSCGLHTPP